jgi:hypothetical protein
MNQRTAQLAVRCLLSAVDVVLPYFRLSLTHIGDVNGGLV